MRTSVFICLALMKLSLGRFASSNNTSDRRVPARPFRSTDRRPDRASAWRSTDTQFLAAPRFPNPWPSRSQ